MGQRIMSMRLSKRYGPERLEAHQLALARGDGSYPRLMNRLARTNLLVIDDWLLTPLNDTERRDILEVIEDRHERASTLIASQLPIWQIDIPPNGLPISGWPKAGPLHRLVMRRSQS